jgi:hypothetical protein
MVDFHRPVLQEVTPVSLILNLIYLYSWTICSRWRTARRAATHRTARWSKHYVGRRCYRSGPTGAAEQRRVIV